MAAAIAAGCASGCAPIWRGCSSATARSAQKKGILHLIVPPEQFELLQGEGDLATYQFNTNTAKHTFCRHCGIHAFYVPRSDPDKISVNARCLEGIDPAALKPTSFFDGRNWEEAQAARKK